MSIPKLTEAQELALLDHLAEKHGLASVDCPACGGLGCRACHGDGVVFRAPIKHCDDPKCPASARMAAIAAGSRS